MEKRRGLHTFANQYQNNPVLEQWMTSNFRAKITHNIVFILKILLLLLQGSYLPLVCCKGHEMHNRMWCTLLISLTWILESSSHSISRGVDSQVFCFQSVVDCCTKSILKFGIHREDLPKCARAKSMRSWLFAARESNPPPYEGGYGRKSNNGYPEEHLAGVWKLDFRTGDALRKTTVKEFGRFSVAEALSRMLALNRDGSLADPPRDEKWVIRDLLGRERLSGYWRVDGDELTVTIRTRSAAGKTVLRFQGRIREGAQRPYGSLVSGNVLDGEESPEWAGDFSMTQVTPRSQEDAGPLP